MNNTSGSLVVSIGSDHRGLAQRRIITAAIESMGHQVTDHGTFSEESCDYPDIAVVVAQSVAAKKSHFGILVCGSGIGMSIAANKVHGIRAALCCNEESVRLSRQHNDANVMCLAGEAFDETGLAAAVKLWLATEFEGGRHARRIEKVTQIEAQQVSSA